MGPVGSWAVDMSILLSQTGFVCRPLKAEVFRLPKIRANQANLGLGSEMLYVAKNCNGALQDCL